MNKKFLQGLIGAVQQKISQVFFQKENKASWIEIKKADGQLYHRNETISYIATNTISDRIDHGSLFTRFSHH